MLIQLIKFFKNMKDKCSFKNYYQHSKSIIKELKHKEHL